MAEIIASTYEPIEKIGAGGGGNVFLANHLRLNKKVVLKADKRKLSTSPELLRREVDVLKNLSHSHIPKVYDFFSEKETVYTVMDYIEGESLDKPLKRGEKFPGAQVVAWAKDLLSALEYLHEPIHGDPPHGYVHGDIKPANMMNTPRNGIVLIDFNISLVLGEENVVGCSAGYASPEHYGLDYSSGFTTRTEAREVGDESTVLLSADETVPLTGSATVPLDRSPSPAVSETSKKSPKKVVPDVRSDIYSVGATLYHLLSGNRPARNAVDVVPLSGREYSPQLVGIIAKAMNPNPDLRYQTAREMLDAFTRLHENDPRAKRLKRQFAVTSAVSAVLLATGLFSAFTGLKRLGTTESRLKLAEYSRTALSEGDAERAVGLAVEAFGEGAGLFSPPPAPEAASALADALGVYDLSDGYKPSRTVELSAAPLSMSISPSGRTCAAVTLGECTVFKTDSAEILVSLPANPSALSEVKYLSETVILYASDGGAAAYDFEKGAPLWIGEKATAIALSEDKTTVAVTEQGSDHAVLYKAETGEEIARIAFGEKRQGGVYNPVFANPETNLFALGADGNALAIGFSDGSLALFYPDAPERDRVIFDGSEDYSYYDGGFYGDFLIVSAVTEGGSDVAAINVKTMEQTTGFRSDRVCSVEVGAAGVFLRGGNLIVALDPETGEQAPIAAAPDVIGRFTVGEKGAVAALADRVAFFEGGSAYTTPTEFPARFLLTAGETAVVGFSDSPAVRLLKYKSCDGALFAYDPDYAHDEARVSADGETLTLFSYRGFRIYDRSGSLAAEVEIPDPDRVYDQQFIRNADDSFLEVIYYDGRVLTYAADSGALLREETRDPPDRSLDEEFLTDRLRIMSPLHGTPTAYDRETGEMIAELEKDAYLTYITEVGENLVAQYVTADGDFYGILMNEKCETLARLPRLSDIVGDRLIFDLSTGYIRESRIYTSAELINAAR